MRSRTLRKAKRCKILLAPEQARQVGDDIFSKRSRGCHFGNESLMQFFELGPIFAQQKAVAE
jgi:hypothetical protein